MMRYRLILKEEQQSNTLKYMQWVLEFIRDNIKYGYLHKSGKLVIAKKFDRYEWLFGYRLQSPKQCLKNRVGVCWDQTELARYFCIKKHIPHATYWCVAGRHAFLVFKDEKNLYYWLETSWRGLIDIHGPYKSVKEIFKAFIQTSKEDRPQTSLQNARICKYDQPPYGCTVLDFLKFVTKKVVYKEDDFSRFDLAGGPSG